ncbi:MAG: hypothetical protein EA363_05005 [Balneolaceae bacterium]|nr:MAG: hypothetical protein EA363_05005 [Balneolaceae bacterium]
METKPALTDNRTSWKILSALMGVVSLGVLSWAASALIFDPDHSNLNILIIWLMVIPALVPLFTSWFMWKGRTWAVWLLRIYLMLILASGTALQSFGLGVFSFAPFAIPFISFCVIWLAVSFWPAGSGTQHQRQA